MKNIPKLRKFENLLLQLFIFAITYFFIYKQVFLKTDINVLFLKMKISISQPGYQTTLLVVFILMGFNWAIEALKWQFLIGRIEKISFSQSLQAVLTGVSISTFTPNRVGEYFGRVFILKNASHIEGILITIVGSMAQLMVTVLTGTLALLLFTPRYMPGVVFTHGYFYYTLLILIAALDIVMVVLFFNLSVLSTLKERILQRRLRRIREFFRIFTFYHNRELALVFLMSMARYAVFSTQYFLLIRFFGVPVPYTDALILIALTYFVMTLIPTIALTELGLRGSVAIYFFSLWLSKTNPGTDYLNAGVLAALVLLWMINLGIPAVVGTLFVFRLQFFRKSG